MSGGFPQPVESQGGSMSKPPAGPNCGEVVRRQGVLYCQDTTLHGFQYLPHRGLLSTTLWSLSLLVTVSLTFYFSTNLFLDFLGQKPMITIDDTTASLQEVSFPSVTLCNVNQVQLSMLEQAGLNIKDPQSDEDTKFLINYYLSGKNIDREPDNWGEKLDEIKKKLDWDPDDRPFAKVAAQNCSHMILQATWQRNMVLSYKAQNTYTDYGVCCRIWPWLDFENNGTRDKPASEYTTAEFLAIPKGARNGVKNGLEVLLDVEAFEYAYFPSGSTGFTLALSDSLVRPVVRQQGFYVPPGSESLVSIQVQQTITTPDALSWFPPDKRKCYKDSLQDPIQESEFQPLYFNRTTAFSYTMSNCLYASIIDKIIKTCRCKPIYAGIDGIVGQSPPDPSLPRCIGQKLTCMEDWVMQWGQSGPELDRTLDTISGQVKKCFQACDTQSTSLVTSFGAYPSSNTMPSRKDFCLVVNKVQDICKDSHRRAVFEAKFSCAVFSSPSAAGCASSGGSFTGGDPALEKAVVDYAKENLAMVKVFLRDPFFTKISRDVRTTRMSFLGNAGGLVGLLTGFSVISLVEILYHLVLLLAALARRH